MAKSNGQINFLPEDYLERRRQRRTNVVCLSLFAVVIAVLVAAFVLKDRTEAAVAAERDMINRRTARVGEQLAQIQEMEARKGRMIRKAEISASLVERRKRSYILARITNALPPGASLVEVGLETRQPAQPKAAKAPPKPARPGAVRAPRSAAPVQAAEKVDEPAPQPIETVHVVGLAPDDKVVSRFIASLNDVPIFKDVDLRYSEQHTYHGNMVRRFKVQMELDPKVEVSEETVRQQKLRPGAME